MKVTLKSVFTFIAVPAFALCILAGCGKKGPPLPPLPPEKGAALLPEKGAALLPENRVWQNEDEIKAGSFIREEQSSRQFKEEGSL